MSLMLGIGLNAIVTSDLHYIRIQVHNDYVKLPYILAPSSSMQIKCALSTHIQEQVLNNIVKPIAFIIQEIVTEIYQFKIHT